MLSPSANVDEDGVDDGEGDGEDGGEDGGETGALGDDGAPGVHDESVPEGDALLVVPPTLGRRHHVALVLDGPGSEQRLPSANPHASRSTLTWAQTQPHLPVRHARLHGEGRGVREDLGAPVPQPGRHKRESKVVALE